MSSKNGLFVPLALAFVAGSVQAQNGSDECATATPIAGLSSWAFDTAGATDSGLIASCNGAPSADIWYAWTPATTDTYRLSVCGASFDLILAVYDACGGSELGCSEGYATGFGNCTGAFEDVALTLPVISGSTYLIQIDGWQGATGTGILDAEIAPIPPPNDDCADATPIVGTGFFPVSNIFATDSGMLSSCNLDFGGTTDNDTWYEWTPTTSGSYDLSICGVGFDILLTAYDECGGTELACSAGYATGVGTCVGGIDDVLISPDVAAGTTYLIQIEGWAGQTGTGMLEIELTQESNDDCASSFEISGTGTFDFNNTLATTDGDSDMACGGPPHVQNDVWFTWTAPCNGDYIISTCGLTTVDTKIAIYDGADCEAAAVLDCDDDTCGLGSEVSGSGLIGGVSYLIRIGTSPGASGGEGQFSITGTAEGGTNYCDGGLNSDGQNAAISMSGSASVAANDLVLVASGLVDLSFAGLFVMGDTQASIPFGNGTLCLDQAGQIFRLNPIINGGGDVIQRAIDNTVVPANAISPGSTWNFQYWYRDHPSTNLTDGISICFQP